MYRDRDKEMRLRECLGWLWKTSKGFRLPAVLNGLTGILQVSVSLCFVWVCKYLIDIVTRHTEASLYTGIACLIGCIIAQLLLSVISTRQGSRIEIRFRNRLRHQLFGRILESRWMGREKLHSGDMLNRLVEDVPVITAALCRNIPSLFATGVQLAGALYFLYRLDPQLTGLLLFITPVALLFSKTYVRRMRRLSREIRTTDSQVQSHLQEQIQHRILIRTLEYTEQAEQALAGLQADLQRKGMRRTDFSIFSRIMVQTGFAAGYATAFLWGIFGLYDGSVTFGMMTAFLQLVAQVQRPMVELSRQIPAFIQVFTATERLEELSSLSPEEQGEAVRLPGRLGICLKDVDYSYPGSSRKVLQGFSHDFLPGSLTAVVGETGAGKSTMLRLMLALLKPDRGSVTLYNGKEREEVSPLTRCNLSYVPQGNTLISGTIRDNLLLGKPEATEAELQAALHTAVADFVMTLPEGLDTLCGEQGAGLSEGQAQRIAIARGLLRPGSILLLDEPTSSLDEETERKLLERLSRQVQDKTLILITHRETIAQLCTSAVRLHKEDA